MQTEEGNTLLRTKIQFDLPAQHAFEMFWNSKPESLNWKPFTAIETLEEISAEEKVIRFSPDAPWVVTKIVGFPEWICARVVSRQNWPNQNHFAVAIIPWDAETNQPVE